MGLECVDHEVWGPSVARAIVTVTLWPYSLSVRAGRKKRQAVSEVLENVSVTAICSVEATVGWLLQWT